MKGIVLAGGTGSRLYPITQGISKQLLPIYDKPMIYYPLSVLMLAGIQEILIITTAEDQSHFQRLLGDGSRFGIRLCYQIQPQPQGIAQAFTLSKHFIGNSSVCLVLGDNIFWGQGFSDFLVRAKQRPVGATLFAYQVNNPNQFGVVTFDEHQKVLHLEEKPRQPRSNYAVTGLYFYDNEVIQLAEQIQPSARGELEITSINQLYLAQDRLYCEILGRGFAWLDTGTHESLLQAAQFVETIEKRQGYKIACLEEIAWRKGWLSSKQIEQAAHTLANSSYGQYLLNLIEGEKR